MIVFYTSILKFPSDISLEITPLLRKHLSARFSLFLKNNVSAPLLVLNSAWTHVGFCGNQDAWWIGSCFVYGERELAAICSKIKHHALMEYINTHQDQSSLLKTLINAYFKALTPVLSVHPLKPYLTDHEWVFYTSTALVLFIESVSGGLLWHCRGSNNYCNVL